MDQFLKDHQLNKAEFGVTDESISVWISGSQDKNPSSYIFGGMKFHVEYSKKP